MSSKWYAKDMKFQIFKDIKSSSQFKKYYHSTCNHFVGHMSNMESDRPKKMKLHSIQLSKHVINSIADWRNRKQQYD